MTSRKWNQAHNVGKGTSSKYTSSNFTYPASKYGYSGYLMLNFLGAHLSACFLLELVFCSRLSLPKPAVIRLPCWNDLFSGCYFFHHMSEYIALFQIENGVWLKLCVPIQTTHCLSFMVTASLTSSSTRRYAPLWYVESPVRNRMHMYKLAMLTGSGSNWMKHHKCNRRLDVYSL